MLLYVFQKGAIMVLVKGSSAQKQCILFMKTFKVFCEILKQMFSSSPGFNVSLCWRKGYCVSWMLQSRTFLFGKLAWRCWGVQQIQLGYEVLLFCFCHKNWRSLDFLPGGEKKQRFFGCKFCSSSFLEFFIFPSAWIFSYPHCSPKSTSALLLEAETFTKFFGPPCGASVVGKIFVAGMVTQLR